MNVDAPSSMITSMAASMLSGRAASRSTPKGLSVRSRTARISSRICSGVQPTMPSVP